MKFLLLEILSSFVFIDASLSDSIGTYFYEDLGCSKENVEQVHYRCPDFSIRNNSCQFKKYNFKANEQINPELLKGSCSHHCLCGEDGRIQCATEDCFERLDSGCSHFDYSLDSCCAIGSVCGPIAKCDIDGEIYQEGYKVFTRNSCEICVCKENFKQEAPFCRRRSCYDQAKHQLEVANFAAPAFFKGENCCPTVWVSVQDTNEIIKINANISPNSEVYCRYGNKKVPLGYGFKTSVKPYGEVVQLTCECTLPPYVICQEK